MWEDDFVLGFERPYYTLFFIRIKTIRIMEAQIPKNQGYFKNQAEAQVSVTKTKITLKIKNFTKYSFV